MARRLWLILPALLLAALAWFALARGQELRGYHGRLLSGGWVYGGELGSGRVALLTDQAPITGFAFGPGGNEVAFCAPTASGDSGLWLVSAPDRLEAVPFEERDEPVARSRLLWTAPPGVALRGPVWWAPDGSHIGLLACRDQSRDLLVVDYGTREAIWITSGAEVLHVAWRPQGDRLAYAARRAGPRPASADPDTSRPAGNAGEADVWLQTVPPGEAKRVGQGGIDLRWSLDGETLRWLQPPSAAGRGPTLPEAAWQEMILETKTGEVRGGRWLPARPAGAIWSPDGQFCAFLRDASKGAGEKPAGQREQPRELVICSTGAIGAEAVSLPGLQLTQLLAWSADSSVVLASDDQSRMFLVGVRPPDPEVLHVAGLDYSHERATHVWPYPDLAAGPPVFSSRGDRLAYVTAEDTEFGPRPFLGRLIVSQLKRTYVGLRPHTEQEQIVLNMRAVASALMMYLTDYDRYPVASDTEEMRTAIGEYVPTQEVFLRPGSKDEVIVKYLLPPGFRVGEIGDPATLVVAIVEYPRFTVVAYADGHVETFNR